MKDRTTQSLRAVSLSLLALCAAQVGCGHARPRDPLRVTRVVLYQNGIGYFERRGKVKGDRVTLRIRRQQITDILKSLTVVDLSNGRAVNIALPVEKSQARRLAALPRQVQQGGGLAALARAFRGSRARVRAKGVSGTGRIVGIDAGADGGGRLTILADDGTLRAFDLAKVRELRVMDRTLEVGLRQALDVALDQGAWKPVELTVHLVGARAHDLLLSYVVEMPTWKPAYRIVLPKEGKGEKALLQGWAVVDNVSGENWDKVQLSLTAGTPLTFRYDLYTPRFVRRPDLSPRQEAYAAAPPPPTDGAAEADEDADEPVMKAEARRSPKTSAAPSRSRMRRPSKKRKAKGDWAADGSIARPKPAPEMNAKLLEKSFKTLVGGSQVGSLFRYDIQKPVTIRDRQSALVSIINQRVPADDVLLYRIDASREHPYRAVRMKNDTGFVLEKGPVAIYRAGTFVGEAVSGRVEAGTQTFVPYALDGRVVVKLEDSVKDEAVELLKINRGWISCEYKRVAVFKYTIHNRTDRATTLYVQRRHRTGWKLLNQAKGTLLEKSYYFVPVKVAAKGKTKFEVREEQPVRKTVRLTSWYGRRALALYIKRADLISSPALDQLKQVIELQRQIARLDSELSRLRRSRDTYGERQHEVRKNIKILGKTRGNADLKRQLVKNLAGLEKNLSDVTREIVQKDMKRGALRDRMSVMFKAITFEVPRSTK